MPAVRWLVSLLCVSAVAAAPVPKELKAKTGDHFPTAPGTRWEYVIEGTDKVDHTRDVSDETVEKDGTRVANFKWTSHAGSYGSQTEYRVSPTGTVERIGFGKGHRFGVPYVMIKGEAKAGETWNAGIEVGGRDTCTRGEVETVTTPAGKFPAFSVRFGPNDTNTYWYAPGVGLVKWNNGNKSIVLSKFTPGKEAKK